MNADQLRVKIGWISAKKIDDLIGICTVSVINKP